MTRRASQTTNCLSTILSSRLKVSFLHWSDVNHHAKASALALRDHPEVNVSWMENAIRKYNYIDISVAVASPTGVHTL